jgi:hypothetical protein
MSTASPFERPRAHRKVHGIAAALLPFESDGRVAVDAFQRHLSASHRAGLENAVNMDTGYVNFLSDVEKTCVLQWTREALGKVCHSWQALISRDRPARSLNSIVSRWMSSSHSAARRSYFRPAGSRGSRRRKKPKFIGKRAAGIRVF